MEPWFTPEQWIQGKTDVTSVELGDQRVVRVGRSCIVDGL